MFEVTNCDLKRSNLLNYYSFNSCLGNKYDRYSHIFAS